MCDLKGGGVRGEVIEPKQNRKGDSSKGGNDNWKKEEDGAGQKNINFLHNPFQYHRLYQSTSEPFRDPTLLNRIPGIREFFRIPRNSIFRQESDSPMSPHPIINFN
jgi:hypothetical protein